MSAQLRQTVVMETEAKYRHLYPVPGEVRTVWRPRPEQTPPDGPWRIWLFMGGRGVGKTRTGAEWTIASARDFPLTNIIGATADDARDIMIEGESGILASAPPTFRPQYFPSKRRLEWPNGARSLIFTADEPERLRGKQHMRLWGDEVASWRYFDSYDQAMFGLRLGRDPRAMLTTTPKSKKRIRDLVAEGKSGTGRVVVTRGTSYDNRANLAPAFFEQIITRYEGTRLGRQELLGELLDDVPGALWERGMFDARKPAPDLSRVVVAIDIATTSGEDSDDTGIVVCGKGVDGRGYVLADRSCHLSPDGWARRAWAAFDEFKADRIVYESNQGGDLIATVLRTVRPHGPLTAVHASRGKRTRAEPVAALYEQGKVTHPAPLDDLEDQLCVAADTLVTTTWGDVRIDQIRAGDSVWTREGWRRVTRAWCTSDSAEVCELRDADDRRLVATVSHPVYTPNRGFTPLGSLKPGDELEVLTWGSMGLPSSGTAFATTWSAPAITGVATACYSIARFGKRRMALYRAVCSSITRTKTRLTGFWEIWNWSRRLSTPSFTVAASGLGTPHGESNRAATYGQTSNRANWSAPNVARPLPPGGCAPDSVLRNVGRSSVTTLTRLPQRVPVWNLAVEGQHEYYANGILTHNCSWTPDSGDSPDRLDALVWGLTSLLIGAREVTFV